MRKLFVFLFIFFLGLSCYAQSVDYGDNYISKSPYSSYITINGVLYLGREEDKPRILVRYPVGKKEQTYEIPATVRDIAPNAFKGNKYLKTIIIPSVWEERLDISTSAFDDTNIEEFIINENATSVSSTRVTPKGDNTKYNFQGMKIDSPQKGELYIQDGKKYVNK